MDRATHNERVGENPSSRDFPRQSSFPINLAPTCVNVGQPSQLSSSRLANCFARKKVFAGDCKTADWIFALTLEKPKSEIAETSAACCGNELCENSMDRNFLTPIARRRTTESFTISAAGRKWIRRLLPMRRF